MQLTAVLSWLDAAILAAAKAAGLKGQAYWMATTLALGAVLKVCLVIC